MISRALKDDGLLMVSVHKILISTAQKYPNRKRVRNASRTRPERVPKCVPFAFHLRSIRVPFAFQLRSICIPLLPERICGTRSGYTRIETGHRRKSSRFAEY
jgi:hypothetical protein